MRYTPPHDDLLCTITYGSHLYGTNTASSDHDFKCVYLPSIRDLLLAKTPSVLTYKFDANGAPLGKSTKMPPNGWEAEHTPVQKFVADFLGGQAYAVEIAFAVSQDYHLKHMPELGDTPLSKEKLDERRRFIAFAALCKTLTNKYVHRNVTGMTGFAMKQTFDYVRRGERLALAKKVDAVLYEIISDLRDLHTGKIRLDTTYDEYTVLDAISLQTGVPMGTTENRGVMIRTLELNGRSYIETSELTQLRAAVGNLILSYGERTKDTLETLVDWKSLSHAVRVYQQVIELLTTQRIKFPRPNAAELIEIKQGKRASDDVKGLLAHLENQTLELIDSSTFPKSDDLRPEAEDLLYSWMKDRY